MLKARLYQVAAGNLVLISLPQSGAVVIVWLLDFKLPMQSVPITTNVVSLNRAQARCARYIIM